MIFKVQPTNSINGVVAPAIFVDANNDDSARKEARQKSGLGRFNTWNFIIVRNDYRCKSYFLVKEKTSHES